MSLEVIENETGPHPTASIIVLHGLGADGNDFVAIAEELDLRAIGPVRFVFPHAPTMPVTINGGYVMRAWYDILGTDLARREDEAGLRRSQALVEGLIARERRRGVESMRIVLAGFSQGGAVALHTALRAPHALAGVLALSTYLPLAPTLANERSAANAATPIFMAHGTADSVLPLRLGESSRRALEALGYKVEWHVYPMAHAVCAEEISTIGGWLAALPASRG